MESIYNLTRWAKKDPATICRCWRCIPFFFSNNSICAVPSSEKASFVYKFNRDIRIIFIAVVGVACSVRVDMLLLMASSKRARTSATAWQLGKRRLWRRTSALRTSTESTLQSSGASSLTRVRAPPTNRRMAQWSEHVVSLRCKLTFYIVKEC